MYSSRGLARPTAITLLVIVSITLLVLVAEDVKSLVLQKTPENQLEMVKRDGYADHTPLRFNAGGIGISSTSVAATSSGSVLADDSFYTVDSPSISVIPQTPPSNLEGSNVGYLSLKAHQKLDDQGSSSETPIHDYNVEAVSVGSATNLNNLATPGNDAGVFDAQVGISGRDSITPLSLQSLTPQAGSGFPDVGPVAARQAGANQDGKCGSSPPRNIPTILTPQVPGSPTGSGATSSCSPYMVATFFAQCPFGGGGPAFTITETQTFLTTSTEFCCTATITSTLPNTAATATITVTAAATCNASALPAGSPQVNSAATTSTSGLPVANPIVPTPATCDGLGCFSARPSGSRSILPSVSSLLVPLTSSGNVLSIGTTTVPTVPTVLASSFSSSRSLTNSGLASAISATRSASIFSSGSAVSTIVVPSNSGSISSSVAFLSSSSPYNLLSGATSTLVASSLLTSSRVASGSATSSPVASSSISSSFSALVTSTSSPIVSGSSTSDSIVSTIPSVVASNILPATTTLAIPQVVSNLLLTSVVTPAATISTSSSVPVAAVIPTSAINSLANVANSLVNQASSVVGGNLLASIVSDVNGIIGLLVPAATGPINDVNVVVSKVGDQIIGLAGIVTSVVGGPAGPVVAGATSAVGQIVNPALSEISKLVAEATGIVGQVIKPTNIGGLLGGLPGVPLAPLLGTVAAVTPAPTQLGGPGQLTVVANGVTSILAAQAVPATTGPARVVSAITVIANGLPTVVGGILNGGGIQLGLGGLGGGLFKEIPQATATTAPQIAKRSSGGDSLENRQLYDNRNAQYHLYRMEPTTTVTISSTTEVTKTIERISTVVIVTADGISGIAAGTVAIDSPPHALSTDSTLRRTKKRMSLG